MTHSYFTANRLESADLIRSIKSPEIYKKTTELSELKKQVLINQQELLLAIETIHNDVNILLKKNEKSRKFDDLISYGNKVWDKLSGIGPLVTVRRIASTIKIGNDNHTVMGWICKDQNGKYLELPEETLSTSEVKTHTRKTKFQISTVVLANLAIISLITNIVLVFC